MFKKIIFSFIFITLLVSCNQDKSLESTTTDNSKTIVAKVNGKPVYKEDYGNSTVPSAIRNEIFYQEGLNQGYGEKFAEKVRNFERGLVINEVKSQAIINYLEENPITDEQKEQIVKSKKDEYYFLKTSIVKTDSKDLINSVLKKAKELGSLKEASEKFGDEIKFSELALSKAYKKYFKDFEKGEFSDVIKDGNNYALYQIEDIKVFSDKDILMRELPKIEAEKKRQALTQYYEDLKNKHEVEVLDN